MQSYIVYRRTNYDRHGWWLITLDSELSLKYNLKQNEWVGCYWMLRWEIPMYTGSEVGVVGGDKPFLWTDSNMLFLSNLWNSVSASWLMLTCPINCREDLVHPLENEVHMRQGLWRGVVAKVQSFNSSAYLTRSSISLRLFLKTKTHCRRRGDKGNDHAVLQRQVLVITG